MTSSRPARCLAPGCWSSGRPSCTDELVEAIDADLGNAELVKVRRLRLADDMPLAILTNYLPSRFEITAEDLQTHGLYECLRARGVNLKIAQQRINARLMTEEEAGLLDEEPPAACLTAERVAYDDTGSFVEFGRHVYRSAHYSIQSSLVVAEHPLRVTRADQARLIRWVRPGGSGQVGQDRRVSRRSSAASAFGSSSTTGAPGCAEATRVRVGCWVAQGTMVMEMLPSWDRAARRREAS